MENRIHIPEPCSVKWSSMSEVNSKLRHCDVCKHSVHDFSKSSLLEIEQKFKEAHGEGLCGHYHERHTENKRVYLFVNNFEKKLIRLNFKRASVLLVAIVLLVSGCAKKYTKGRRVRANFMTPEKHMPSDYKSKMIGK